VIPKFQDWDCQSWDSGLTKKAGIRDPGIAISSDSQGTNRVFYKPTQRKWLITCDYLTALVILAPAPTITFNPPANFSQFKHWPAFACLASLTCSLVLPPIEKKYLVNFLAWFNDDCPPEVLKVALLRRAIHFESSMDVDTPDQRWPWSDFLGSVYNRENFPVW